MKGSATSEGNPKSYAASSARTGIRPSRTSKTAVSVRSFVSIFKVCSPSESAKTVFPSSLTARGVLINPISFPSSATEFTLSSYHLPTTSNFSFTSAFSISSRPETLAARLSVLTISNVSTFFEVVSVKVFGP